LPCFCLQATHEWQDGVLARIMRGACKDESPDQKWILFDGPVDTLWIESMNTTLDDNKLLTLLSGMCCWGPPCTNRACPICELLAPFDSTASTFPCAGERIAMPAQVSLLFEVEDLSQASPATVSRAGMIYLNVEDMGWRPYITSWLSAKAAGSNSGATEGAGTAVNQQFVEHLTKLIERYLEAALEYKRLHCR
jgi:dynein heavy chain